MPDIEIWTLPEFERDVNRLERHYPSVRADVEAAKRLLKAGSLLLQQRRYPGFGQRAFWKGRVINRDKDRGKSAGYRLIWEQTSGITLVYLYEKNIPEHDVIAEIRRRLRR